MQVGEQPVLHELVTVVRAPMIAISAPGGQLLGEGVQGFYLHDRRSLSRLEIEVAGARLVPTGFRLESAADASFHGVLRVHGERSNDPSVTYSRRRRLYDEFLYEVFSLHNYSGKPLLATVAATASSDFAAMDAVRSGRPHTETTPEATHDGAQWTFEGYRVGLALNRAADGVVADGQATRWTWHVSIPPGHSWDLRANVSHGETVADDTFLPQRPQRTVDLIAPEVPEAGSDAARLLERCLADLDALQLRDPKIERSVFAAAGSPWYLTLFGRDSIWTARFLLPLSTEFAAGTLRVLAARQGTGNNPETEEQPGKIPHEHRRAEVELGADRHRRVHLPPLYYGTVDATALWVCLLHEAWLAGMPKSEVDDLLPALRAALEWMAGPGDPDSDGFCEYRGSAAAGLSNQGWKDSHDGVRWSDGTIASRPLALCEVQGYAHAAALGGAELLDAFGADGTRWRTWAGELRRQFREQFWIEDEHGRYPAIALDGEKRPVSGPASNMAHLLGTGLLSVEESGIVAKQLTTPALDGGYGLRTLSQRTAGFNPLSYHCGSVWPHDTAIAVLGLAAEGHHQQARALAQGMVRAASSFDFRLPELFGGTDFWAGEPAVAYPAACQPQAWAAAGGVAVVGYLQGWHNQPLRSVRRVVP